MLITEPDRMSDEQWEIYRGVISEAQRANIPFAIGGGLAVGVYSGRWRETKDMDFYVLRKDLRRLQEILTKFGLSDYFDQLPYDREWIYRSIRDKIIVDVIWSMANYHAQVDETWIGGGPEVTIRGETFRIVPVEEMIWAKLYVVQKDRCDWPDAMNMIYAQRNNLDWQHLLDRLGDDTPLLKALLSVCAWLCPNFQRDLPGDLISQIERRIVGSSAENSRAELLDRRNWFGAQNRG